MSKQLFESWCKEECRKLYPSHSSQVGFTLRAENSATRPSTPINALSINRALLCPSTALIASSNSFRTEDQLLSQPSYSPKASHELARR